MAAIPEESSLLPREPHGPQNTLLPQAPSSPARRDAARGPPLARVVPSMSPERGLQQCLARGRAQRMHVG